MEEFESDHCPICHKIVNVNTNAKISEATRSTLGSKLYVPDQDATPEPFTQDEEAYRNELLEFLKENRPKSNIVVDEPPEDE